MAGGLPTNIASNISGGNVSLNANKDIALVGVNVVAEDSLTGKNSGDTILNYLTADVFDCTLG